MSRNGTNVPREESFICVNCGASVRPAQGGTSHRNHCPFCLWSRHVDLRVGDRASRCGGAMRPLAVWAAPDGEWRLLHRCERCATIRANRIGPDDSEAALLGLAARALANVPFMAKGKV